MDAVREAWTDERLDDLTRRMDQGFDRVDKDLRELRADMAAVHDGLRADMAAGHDGLRAGIAAGRSELKAEMDARFSRLEARFDSMQRMTLGAYVAAVLGLIATQL